MTRRTNRPPGVTGNGMIGFALIAVFAVLAALLTSPAAAERRGEDEPRTLSDGHPLWRSSVLNGANGLYVGPDGNVYTGSVFGNEIVVQNPRNGRVIDRIGAERGVNGPDDIFITDDGTIYWTDILGGTVGMLKPGEEPVTQLIAPGVNPITMSDDGRLFVGLVFLGVGVFELDPDLIEPPVALFADPTPVIGMNGMDFGPDGMLYGPLFFSGAVARIDVSNLVPGENPPVEVVAEGFRVPSAVKFNSAGELHVSDLAEGQIVKVDLESGEREVLVDIEGIIDNLAFDGRDQLFFAADADGQLMKVVRPGRVRAMNRTGFTGPSSIAQTSDGTIWVADGGELQGFTGRWNPTSKIYFRFDPPFAGLAGANTVAADGDHLITVGLLTGAVQVLDPATQTILEDYRVPGAPTINAIAHGDQLVAAKLGLGVVDVRTDAVISSDFAYPLGLASDGTTLYVSDYALGTVTAIGPSGSAVIAEGLVTPEGLALDGNHLLVVEEALDRVSAIDLATGNVFPIITGFDMGPSAPTSDFSLPHNNLNGVMVSSKGHIYVSQSGEVNGVFRFRPERYNR